MKRIQGRAVYLEKQKKRKKGEEKNKNNLLDAAENVGFLFTSLILWLLPFSHSEYGIVRVLVLYHMNVMLRLALGRSGGVARKCCTRGYDHEGIIS